MQLQLIYDEIAEKKQEERSLKRLYKDALANANEFEETVSKMKELRDKKKQIEAITRTKLGTSWERLETIKAEVKEKKVMMTDVAMTILMDGKTVLIKDEYNEYEPVWSVKFRKV